MQRLFIGHRENRDLVTGICIVFLSCVFLFISCSYPIGTLASMGAGFFPIAMSILTLSFGLAIALGVFGDKSNGIDQIAPISMINWRALLFISSAVSFFGLMIEPFGLIPSVAGATIISARADSENTWKAVGVLGVSLACGIWFVLVGLLGLPISAFGK